MSRRLVAVAMALAVVLAAAGLPVSAQADRPGTLVLAVDGAVAERLSRAELEALPQAEIVTRTPWTDGRVRFTGVPLAALVERVGANGDTLRARALNDYAVTIPLADAARHGVLVATRMDGAAMPVRRFGPYWIVYPLSAKPEIATAQTQAKMIWQLSRLEF